MIDNPVQRARQVRLQVRIYVIRNIFVRFLAIFWQVQEGDGVEIIPDFTNCQQCSSIFDLSSVFLSFRLKEGRRWCKTSRFIDDGFRTLTNEFYSVRYLLCNTFDQRLQSGWTTVIHSSMMDPDGLEHRSSHCSFNVGLHASYSVRRKDLITHRRRDGLTFKVHRLFLVTTSSATARNMTSCLVLRFIGEVSCFWVPCQLGELRRLSVPVRPFRQWRHFGSSNLEAVPATGIQMVLRFHLLLVR